MTPTEDGQISSLVNKAIEDWMVTKRTWKIQMQLESSPVFHLGLKFFLNTILAFQALRQ